MKNVQPDDHKSLLHHCLQERHKSMRIGHQWKRLTEDRATLSHEVHSSLRSGEEYLSTREEEQLRRRKEARFWLSVRNHPYTARQNYKVFHTHSSREGCDEMLIAISNIWYDVICRLALLTSVTNNL
ncbi:hypothetical protein ElyMa_003194600 [Elysia marginata]|uniref:Uncharacterized protein n=1 Tax=Elysia marginata TaxID=1093978 RepID=A0AAV4J358_9GAST|nr:hypothetical protein ElyMa_003194600 [Elysia marginata]